MTDHFICKRCGARGHLVKERDDCPNCGGPIEPVVITRPAQGSPCCYCDAYDTLAEACTMPSQYSCPLETNPKDSKEPQSMQEACAMITEVLQEMVQPLVDGVIIPIIHKAVSVIDSFQTAKKEGGKPLK